MIKLQKLIYMIYGLFDASWKKRCRLKALFSCTRIYTKSVIVKQTLTYFDKLPSFIYSVVFKHTKNSIKMVLFNIPVCLMW